MSGKSGSDNIYQITNRRAGLASAGGPPDPPDMELVKQRLSAVEAGLGRLDGRMDKLDTRMDAIDGRLRAVEQKLAAIDAKFDLLVNSIVGKLPSWWQMPMVIGSTVTLLVALYALVQFLRAHGLQL